MRKRRSWLGKKAQEDREKRWRQNGVGEKEEEEEEEDERGEDPAEGMGKKEEREESRRCCSRRRMARAGREGRRRSEEPTGEISTGTQKKMTQGRGCNVSFGNFNLD